MLVALRSRWKLRRAYSSLAALCSHRNKQHWQREDAAPLRLDQLELPVISRTDYANLLRQCGSRRSLEAGRRVHTHIVAAGKDQDEFLGNTIVQMYGSCGSMGEALAAFDRVRGVRNEFSWCILITAFAQNGDQDAARAWFNKMPSRNVVAWNAMITMYAQGREFQRANELFDIMPERSVASWNTMITACGSDRHRLRFLSRMDLDGMLPEKVTFLCLLGGVEDLATGKLVHSCAVETDLVSDVLVATVLLNMYGKCGEVDCSRCLFDGIRQRNAMSWNAMLTAYAHNGHLPQARVMLDKMPQRDAISWNVLLRAFTRFGQIPEARELFDEIPVLDSVSLTIMGGAYAGEGHLQKAREMFGRVNCRNVVTWTAFIACCMQNGEQQEAVRLFKLMDLDGVKPNHVTFTAVLDACASMASLREGKLIHLLIQDPVMKENQGVLSSLVRLYSNCGQLDRARETFDSLSSKSKTLVLWTSMISAYARCGRGAEAVAMYRGMCLEGELPDDVTFTSILSACSHSGLGRDAVRFFESILDSGLRPTRTHLNCVVDLLARAGELGDAEELLKSMPYVPDFVANTSFLSSCRIHEDAKRGLRAASEIVEWNPHESSSYSLLGSMNSAA